MFKSLTSMVDFGKKLDLFGILMGRVEAMLKSCFYVDIQK